MIDLADNSRVFVIAVFGASSSLAGYLEILNGIVALVIGLATVANVFYKVLEQRKKYLSQRQRNEWEIQDREGNS